MIVDVLIRALHFIAILVAFGGVVGAHLLTARQLPRRTVRRLAVVDTVSLLGLLTAIVTGFLLWFVFGKPAAFYTPNGIFHTKVLLAVVVLGLGVYPGLFWWRQRRGAPDDTVDVPVAITALQGVQLLLLVAIPVLASLMAAGIGRGDG